MLEWTVEPPIPAGMQALSLRHHDVTLEGRLERTEQAHLGGYVSTYRLLDDPHGYAHVSVAGGSVTATIRTGDRLFQLRPAADGLHILSETADVFLEPCGTRGPGIERYLGSFC